MLLAPRVGLVGSARQVFRGSRALLALWAPRAVLGALVASERPGSGLRALQDLRALLVARAELVVRAAREELVEPAVRVRLVGSV